MTRPPVLGMAIPDRSAPRRRQQDDGQISSVTEAGGAGATVTSRTTSYQYDANGNKTSVTDARGYTTTTAYDADDGPSLVTDPYGNEDLTCYDGDGNVTQTVPPAGVAADRKIVQR